MFDFTAFINAYGALSAPALVTLIILGAFALAAFAIYVVFSITRKKSTK